MSQSVSRWLVLVLALVSVASFETVQASIVHLEPSINANRDQWGNFVRNHYFGDPIAPVLEPIYINVQSRGVDRSTGPKLTTSTTTTPPPPPPPTTSTAKKFIILTTGEQLKLYPLVPNDGRTPGDQAEFMPTYGHYLIKPRKAGQQVEAAKVLEDSWKSLSKLLLALRADENKKEDHHQKVAGLLRDGMTIGQSILPTSGIWQDGINLGSGKDKEPLIVDVDYFFDTKFCQSASLHDHHLAPNDCLVIVWLDKNNKLVRYGSINLAKNPIIKTLSSDHESSSSSPSSSSKVLWLEEYPPIKVVDDGTTSNHEQGQVFGMVVDRRRSKIHVAFSDGSTPYANRILSNEFNFLPINNLSFELGFSPKAPRPETTIFKFNECKHPPIDDAAASSADRPRNSFENLSLDEETGDWLFYFDHYKGGRIFALNIVNKVQKAMIVVESDEENQFSGRKGKQADSIVVAGQALVRDIALGAWPKHGGAETMVMTSKITANRNATGMAMDSGRRRLYLLDEGNEIHECDYAGYNDKLIGKLSPKPVIRSPHSMQVFRETLYLSDPIKKSLIAYKLPNNQKVGSPSDHETRSGNDNKNNGDYKGRQALDDTIQSTHQVLLVETPTIYGFRLVDIENIGKTTHDDRSGRTNGLSIRSEGRRALDKEEEDLINNDYLKGPKTTTLLGDRRQQLPYLEDGLFIKPVGPATTNSAALPDYSHLLLDRVSSRFQCGYDQPDSSKRTKSQGDRLFFFLVGLGLFNVAFSALWLLFCYIRKRAKAKGEDRLITDPVMISHKCQV